MSKRDVANNEIFRENYKKAIGAYLATFSLLLLGGDTIHSYESPTDTFEQLPKVAYRQPSHKIETRSTNNLDLPDSNQLQSLLNSLRSNEQVASKEAVTNALRIIDGPAGQCTGLQIDESGIYLTARHCMFYTYKDDKYGWNTNIGDSYVRNPYTGEVNRGTGFIAHPRADIALLFAPSGKESMPMRGIKIASQTFDREQLWLTGFIPSKDPEEPPTLFIKSGITDEDYQFQSSESPTKWLRTYSDIASLQLAVMNIRPYGGTSGSPIVNNLSEVAGVESGVVFTGNDFTNIHSNYDGARIIKPDAISDLASYTPIPLL